MHSQFYGRFLNKDTLFSDTTVSPVETSSMEMVTLTTESSLDMESTSEDAHWKRTMSTVKTEAISHTTVTSQLRTVKSNAESAGGANNAAIKSSQNHVLLIIWSFLLLILSV